jgi:hypothetical protein
MTRVALYVEGAVVAQPRRESPLERLWQALAARVCAAPDIEVVGISKGHIEHLRHDPPAGGSWTKLPTNVLGIDQLIRDRHLVKPLENVVSRSTASRRSQRRISQVPGGAPRSNGCCGG